MAAEANIRILMECTGLGPGVVEFPSKFTDGTTPTMVTKVEQVISTTAALLSIAVNRRCAEILGVGIRARDGDIYVNTISTNVSTAGTYIPDGQSEFMTFSPGNSCVITYKGSDADTAMTVVAYGALTA